MYPFYKYKGWFSLFCLILALLPSYYYIALGQPQRKELKIDGWWSEDQGTQGSKKTLESKPSDIRSATLSKESALVKFINTLNTLEEGSLEDSQPITTGQPSADISTDDEPEVEGTCIEQDDFELKELYVELEWKECSLSKIQNLSKSYSSSFKSEKKHYLKTDEYEKVTCANLARDAKRILESEPISHNRNHTTILCVALRTKHNYIKKFAFCNRIALKKWTVRNYADNYTKKAEDLGYAFIAAEPSHAEGQFLQFLYKVCTQKPGLYTHIVGMGCSRLHCLECDAVLKLILGIKYKEITAAVEEQEKRSRADLKRNSMNLEEQGESLEADIGGLKIEEEFYLSRETPCKTLEGSDAVSKRVSSNFRIEAILKHLINIRSGHSLDFLGKRYAKELKPAVEEVFEEDDEPMEQVEKKSKKGKKKKSEETPTTAQGGSDSLQPQSSETKVAKGKQSQTGEQKLESKSVNQDLQPKNEPKKGKKRKPEEISTTTQGGSDSLQPQSSEMKAAKGKKLKTSIARYFEG